MPVPCRLPPTWHRESSLGCDRIWPATPPPEPIRAFSSPQPATPSLIWLCLHSSPTSSPSPLNTVFPRPWPPLHSRNLPALSCPWNPAGVLHTHTHSQVLGLTPHSQRPAAEQAGWAPWLPSSLAPCAWALTSSSAEQLES